MERKNKNQIETRIITEKGTEKKAEKHVNKSKKQETVKEK